MIVIGFLLLLLLFAVSPVWGWVALLVLLPWMVLKLLGTPIRMRMPIRWPFLAAMLVLVLAVMLLEN